MKKIYMLVSASKRHGADHDFQRQLDDLVTAMMEISTDIQLRQRTPSKLRIELRIDDALVIEAIRIIDTAAQSAALESYILVAPEDCPM